MELISADTKQDTNQFMKSLLFFFNGIHSMEDRTATPWKAEQHLQGIEIQEKKAQKD